MTLVERKNMLSLPTISALDVMAYLDVKKSKAYEITAYCRKHLNGSTGYITGRITTASFCRYMGSDLESEFKKICTLIKLQEQ